MLLAARTQSSPRRTIGGLARRRPVGLIGAGLVVLEALFGLVGAPWAPLAAAALLAGPGLAWLPALPRRVRGERLAAVAAAPALSLALATVALITLSRLGIPLTGTSVRLTLLALVAVGLALPGDEPDTPAPAWAPFALAGALTVAGVLAGRVIHGFPVPGNDWAKYVLYADQIRREHALLIDNPYWMLGVPFREDPGAPSVYAAFLLLTGTGAATLVHGLWVLTLAAVASAYAWVRSFAPAAAAALTAGLLAVIPANQDMLGWHGVANVAALVLLPVALALVVPLTRDRLSITEAVGAAVVLVALAATHRLSAAVTVAVLGLALLASARGRWRTLLANGARVGAAVVVLGLVVALDLRARQATFGGTLPYTDYLNTKLSLHALARDLTWPLCGAAAVAAIALAVRRRWEAALLAALALFAVSGALIYGYVLHVPLSYLRMAYYLPLALAPVVAVALVRLAPRRVAAAGAAALLVVMAALAWPQAAVVRRFYGFTDASALRGLDRLAGQLRPGEVVATDRCWSFLATWLLHTRTLPALDPADIQPAAELPIARSAQAVMADTDAGRRTARRLGIRYAVTNPGCVTPGGRSLRPPAGARPVFASAKLVVFRLRR